MSDLTYADDLIRRVLTNTRSIAVAGASANPSRPAYDVMEYLIQRGYGVTPVNPGHTFIQNIKCYSTLADIPHAIDMVDIFRRSDRAGAVVDEAIAIGAKTVWMQLDVRDDEAAERGRAAGLTVIMDRCPRIEIGRLGL